MPSAEVINVDFAALRAAAESLSVKAKRLEAIMNTLQQSLAPIKETWYASGSSAGQAAEQSETRLRTAVADITAVIAQFSAKTTEAHDMQVALENKNTSFFG
ncbi:hypothetical protein Asp14428_12980 [Actinoplanes sp. NBRC 14428]|uniref:Type VII secretion system (Wss) protein ESAT-6 n=1 Tax=Pseudosporangium ferrugineum TaxID=439699 RepID=A0A2T0SEV1_9ACTN|nr:WXG100 family type VII secretion target [Pseudosporangium ferrugineum]PRY31939.1 type VII secretion system (Wss) protein ESAT-6 [Pseudosporangium ferrugineum]BCJ49823.1 hypothetical protein Asp14428_12980 [Actinoplanes sp. NBRC 14428]